MTGFDALPPEGGDLTPGRGFTAGTPRPPDAPGHLGHLGPRPVEERVRRALAARADLVDAESLRPAPGTDVLQLVARPPARGRARWVPVLAAAAAAAAVLAVAGRLVIWPADGDAGKVAAAAGPTSSVTAPGSAPTSGPEGTAGVTPAATSPADSPTAAQTSAPEPTPAATVSTGPTVAPCSITEMAAVVLPDSPSRSHPRTGGAPPTVGVTVSVTNTSSHPCRVTGYLGVGLYAAGRLVSATTTVRGNTAYAADPGPQTVVLVPGASAFADLSWATAATTAAKRAVVDQLRVILPDQRDQLSIPLASAIIGGDPVRATALTAVPIPLKVA